MDVRGEIIEADVICPQDDDSQNCDLFFVVDFRPVTVSYFYLVSEDNSIQVQGEDPVFNQFYDISTTQSFAVSKVSLS